MRRMHIISEPDYIAGGIVYREDKERYMRDPELREAFEAGCEHGYRKAHEEMGGDGYSERRMYDDRGRVIQYRDFGRDHILYRDHDGMMPDDDYDERRHRSRITGRYIR